MAAHSHSQPRPGVWQPGLQAAGTAAPTAPARGWKQPAPLAKAASAGRGRGSGKGRGRSGSKQQASDSVRVPANLMQLVPHKYRYAFSVGNDQAEVDKWIAARRRRYPTKANQAAQLQDACDRAARGEVVPATDQGLMGSSKRPRPPSASQPAGLVDYSDSDDCEGSAKATQVAEKAPPASVSQGGGAGQDQVRPGAKRARPNPRGRDASHTTAGAAGSRLGNQRDSARGGRGRGRAARMHRTSLLRKLLAGEMRKENSIILQCIRHVRQEGFLQHVPLHGAQPLDASSSTSQSSDDSSSSDDHSSADEGSSSEEEQA